MLALQQSLGATRGCTSCLALPGLSRNVPRMLLTPVSRLMPNAASLPALNLGVEPSVVPDIADPSVVTGARLAFKMIIVSAKKFASRLLSR